MNLKENIEDLFASVSQNMIPKACELILDGTLGTVLPGVMNTVLAYKQKRSERMYLLFMQELKNRIDELEKNLENISNKSYMEMKEKYFGIISDYVLEEIQEEKIKYLANGFINMSKIKELNENFVLLYYDTLQQLRIIDIAVLKNHERIYSYNQKKTKKTFRDVMNEFSIDFEQFNSIRGKLERLGLLTTARNENENNLYDNLNEIQSYLVCLDKGTAKKLNKFKKLERYNNFEISKYGKEFLSFFKS